GFARTEADAAFDERAHPARGSWHVGAFTDRETAVGDQRSRAGLVELVLCGAGESGLARNAPDSAVLQILRAWMLVEIVLDAPALDLLQTLDGGELDAVWIVNDAVGIRTGDDFRAQLMQLLDRVDRHVPGAGYDAGLAFDRFTARLEHFLDEVHDPVTGRLTPHERSAPARALAGEHAGFVAIRHALVLAEQIADFAFTDAYVARRHVGEFPEMAMQLRHEALAEVHHLIVAAALGIEIRAALGAADRHAGDGVLEDLLGPEELDDAQVHRRVEAQPPLVGTEHAVELHAKAAIDVHFTAIISPRHAENDLTLRLADALDDLVLGILRMSAQHGAERFGDFPDGLMELGLAGIAPYDIGDDGLDSCIHVRHAGLVFNSHGGARRVGCIAIDASPAGRRHPC